MKKACLLVFVLLHASVAPLTGQAQGHGHGSPASTPGSMTNAVPVTNITLFVQPMLIPSNAVPARVAPDGLWVYDMRMRTNLHRFHPDLDPVPIWGYTDAAGRPGSSPGPTIQTTNGMPIHVRWIDELPATFPDWIPADTRNHGVSNQDVYNVVHLHGGANRPLFDGHPTYRFRPGTETNYFYDNIDLSHGQDGETLWYHDHALGMTANNVYAGLAGLYLLRNPEFEQQTGLPSREFEIPLVFQDRDIQTNVPPATLLSDLASPNANPWHYLPVVNGLIAPYFEVEPRRYRFRVLNGCSFRTIGLALVTQPTGASTATNVPIYQIGTDDGFLPTCVVIPSTNATPPRALPTLRLMPGERADLVVDFTHWQDQHIVVTNDLRAGEAAAPPFAPINVVGNAFLEFRVVKALSSPDTSRDFSTNAVIYSDAPTAQQLADRAVKTRTVTLDLRIELPNPGMNFAADTHLFALLNMRNFDAPVTELPRAGDVEIWEFINLTGAPHPMHVHLLDFLVLDRRSFRGWNGDPAYVPQGVADFISDRQLGRLKPLPDYLDLTTNGVRFVQRNELGPKDVVHAAPAAVTRIVMQWPTNEIFYGPYVYHCHILDHEDNDMMRPLDVLPPLPKDALFTTFDLLENAMSLQLGTRAEPVNGPAVTYDVQASSDLQSWQSLTNAVGTGMTLYLRDPQAYALDPSGQPTGDPHRFYRALRNP